MGIRRDGGPSSHISHVIEFLICSETYLGSIGSGVWFCLTQIDELVGLYSLSTLCACAIPGI